jgi:Zn-finger protein
MTRNNKRLTTEEFIKRAKKVHGDKYDYSKVIIKNMNSPVTIICKEHGEFLQTPSKHIHGGQKCPDCALIQRAEKRKMTLNEFTFQANEVHDSKYDYSKVIIKNMNSPVTIICKEHGEFLQTPSKHIHGGQKCPDCALIQRAEKRKMTLNEFTFQANEVHDSKYDYSKVIIKNMNSNHNL